MLIVDECHRSVFGKMMQSAPKTFPNTVFFGFSGTPDFGKDKNTADVFGNKLHRYMIADGVRDKNVLGFGSYMVMTHKDKNLRTAVALEQAKAAALEEVMAAPAKFERFYYFTNKKDPMAGKIKEDDLASKGIEDFVSSVQYRRDEHIDAVVADIVDNFDVLSHCGKFHAIFATSSIPEAVEYIIAASKRPCRA